MSKSKRDGETILHRQNRSWKTLKKHIHRRRIRCSSR